MGEECKYYSDKRGCRWGTNTSYTRDRWEENVQVSLWFRLRIRVQVAEVCCVYEEYVTLQEISPLDLQGGLEIM
jgi:hypothetical protein